MKKDFWVGTAPFCNGQKSDCGRTPGFVCDKTDKKGDGKKCWFGKKVHCHFDPNEFRKTKEYQLIKDKCGEKPEGWEPELKWFGTSPYCDVTDEEVAIKGYLPIKHDNSGDGAPCLKGYKILGMKPACQAQQDEMDVLIEKYKKEGSPTTFTRILDLILNNVPSGDPRVDVAKKGINFIKDIATKNS